MWQRSGRWDQYLASRTMLTVTDRSDAVFGLAPTAEEVVTDYAASVVKSYKQLPVTFFQQHTKFRDEIRPRFGLMRVKEFIMMDAYSFHGSEESLDATYQEMRAAYSRAFLRLGLEAFAVEADSGAIGGSGSHEFMVAADVGEDTVLICPDGGYGANSLERAGHRAAATRISWSAPAGGRDHPHAERADHQRGGRLPENPRPSRPAGRQPGQDRALHGRTEHLRVRMRSRPASPATARSMRSKLLNAVTRALGPKGPVLSLRPMTKDEVRADASDGAEPGFAGPTKELMACDCGSWSMPVTCSMLASW